MPHLDAARTHALALFLQVRLVSKSSESFTVNWTAPSTLPLADYYVVKLCSSTVCSYYPNSGTGNKSGAHRFPKGQAVLDRLAGQPLLSNTAYNLTVYSCGYYDADGDGILSGDEGCEPTGSSLPYLVQPAGLAAPVTDLRVTQVSAQPTVLRSGPTGGHTSQASIPPEGVGARERVSV